MNNDLVQGVNIPLTLFFIPRKMIDTIMRHNNLKSTLLPDIPGLFFFVSFLGMVFSNKGKVLGDGDTFWHLKAGLTMLEQGSLLTHDIFSHTAYGRPWMAHEWLTEICMALIYRLTGLQGVAIFYCFVAALSFWLLFKIILKDGEEWIALSCVLLAFGLSVGHMLARPHIFSWLFGTLTLYILLQGTRKLYFLPFITILWANFHGGFILGLVLQVIFITGSFFDLLGDKTKPVWHNFWQKQKKSIFVAITCILASGINPFGYHLLVFPFLVTKEIFTNSIYEWLSPNMKTMYYFRYYLLGLLVIVSLPQVKINWTNRLILFFFFNAALMHSRNISIAALVMTPFLAESLISLKQDIYLSAKPKERFRNLKMSELTGPLMTVIIFVLFMIINCPVSPLGHKFFQRSIPIPAQKQPIEMTAFLNAHPLPGNIFNHYGWGGYLIYALNPSRKVFIDGRADMYGEKIYGDYSKISDIRKETNELLDQYKIDIVLFPRDAALIRYLKATGPWEEVYFDNEASVLLRKSDFNLPLIGQNPKNRN